MRGIRVASVLALSVTIGACGSVESAAPAAATATPDPAGLRFVKPPVVVYAPEWGSVDVWVRLNRPLRSAVGHPGELDDTPASLEVAGGLHDVPGLLATFRRPTCYSESLYLPEKAEPLQAGQPVEVALVLSEQHRVTGTATVQIAGDGAQPRPVRELGCPSQRPGAPPTRRCDGVVGSHSVSIGLVSATGTSCRRAREVLTSVSRWASSRCFEDLCVARHRRNRGYRCEVGRTGEADWDISCRRGRAEVRGYTSE
ncbi:hypothetical protein [Solirubrobacter pauli]|nr:hypothetical protein [Solirubrobacter pauli]